MATIHLAECDPEQHPGWVKTIAITAAVDYHARHCPRTEYMAAEMYPDETVLVEADDEPEEGSDAEG